MVALTSTHKHDQSNQHKLSAIENFVLSGIAAVGI